MHHFNGWTQPQMVENHMRNLRHVELTNTRVVVDGHDISDMVVAAQLEVRATHHPILTLEAIPDEILFAGEAEVSGVPLDGIARLRARCLNH